MRDSRALLPCLQATVRPSAPIETDGTRSQGQDERQARAAARLILKRVGIAPLLPALAALMVMAMPTGADAQSGAVARPPQGAGRVAASASARATILPSSARLEQGGLRVTQAGARGPALALQPQVSNRPCETDPPSDAPPCQMIVYHLP